MVEDTKINIKIILLGKGGVGKTSLTLSYMFNEFEDVYEPTKLDTYNIEKTYDGHKCDVIIIDTAGQEDYATVVDQTIRSADVYILDSFQECKNLREKIQRITNNDDPPLVLIGNKIDLASKEPNIRAVPISDAENLAHTWNVNYFETSAKTKHNVDEFFNTAIGLIAPIKIAALPKPVKKHRKKQKFREIKRKLCQIL